MIAKSPSSGPRTPARARSRWTPVTLSVAVLLAAPTASAQLTSISYNDTPDGFQWLVNWNFAGSNPNNLSPGLVQRLNAPGAVEWFPYVELIVSQFDPTTRVFFLTFVGQHIIGPHNPGTIDAIPNPNTATYNIFQPQAFGFYPPTNGFQPVTNTFGIPLDPVIVPHPNGPGHVNRFELFYSRAIEPSTDIQYLFTGIHVIIPEPSTYALLGSGLLTLGGVVARRKRVAVEPDASRT